MAYFHHILFLEQCPKNRGACHWELAFDHKPSHMGFTHIVNIQLKGEGLGHPLKVNGISRHFVVAVWIFLTQYRGFKVFFIIGGTS
jgi:hypothetical protein